MGRRKILLMMSLALSLILVGCGRAGQVSQPPRSEMPTARLAMGESFESSDWVYTVEKFRRTHEIVGSNHFLVAKAAADEEFVVVDVAVANKHESGQRFIMDFKLRGENGETYEPAWDTLPYLNNQEIENITDPSTLIIAHQIAGGAKVSQQVAFRVPKRAKVIFEIPAESGAAWALD